MFQLGSSNAWQVADATLAVSAACTPVVLSGPHARTQSALLEQVKVAVAGEMDAEVVLFTLVIVGVAVLRM